MYPQQIIDALRHVRYPGTGKDLIESGMLEDDIRISGLEVSFSLIFEKDNDPFMKSVVKASEVAVQTYVDANAAVHIHTKFKKQNLQPAAAAPVLQAKHVIAIQRDGGCTEQVQFDYNEATITDEQKASTTASFSRPWNLWTVATS